MLPADYHMILCVFAYVLCMCVCICVVCVLCVFCDVTTGHVGGYACMCSVPIDALQCKQTRPCRAQERRARSLICSNYSAPEVLPESRVRLVFSRDSDKKTLLFDSQANMDPKERVSVSAPRRVWGRGEEDVA